jgi:hypothetical protein
LILVGTLLAMLLGAPVGAADAPVPTHAVGDKVGFGTTTDLGAAAAPILQLIRAADQNDPNITFHELSFAGTFDLWSTTEVVGKSADAYSIRTNSALGFKIDYVVNVTSTKFPKAGTYPGNARSGVCLPGSFDVATETIVADVNITYLLASTGLASWTVAEFALRGGETNTSVELGGTAIYHNVPYFELNQTACTFTVSYISADTTPSADVHLDLQTAYTPALDVFAFPIRDGETWPVNSSLTQGGHIRGTVDVGGLTPDQEQEFFMHLNHAFESAGLSASGLSAFPIDLENVTIMAGLTPLLKDGVIHDATFPVNLGLRARETKMTLADGNLHTVFLVSDSTLGLCSQVYSPDDGFVVGVRCEFQGFPFFELPNVPPATAEQHIADTKRDYSLSPTASTGGPEVVANFFLKPPFLGILMIAAVALLVTGILVRRRMKPPAGMPPMPPMPPEAPPPGPP